MQPIQPDLLGPCLRRFEGRRAYIHFEFCRGGFVRNMAAQVRTVSLRGDGPFRLGIHCEQDGWVVMQELTHFDATGPVLFLGAFDEDQRLSRALQLSLEPLPVLQGSDAAPGMTAAGKRILAVLAHPDDESFICGGTLARYSKEGAQITLLCATRGEMGRRLGLPPVATRESLPVLREQELREACDALGIRDLRLMGLQDKTVDYYDPAELAERVRAVMQEIQPAVVITFHETVGGHPDHCAIGRATRLAFEAGGLPDGARLYCLLWNAKDELLERAGATRERVTAIAVEGEAARAKLVAFRAHRTQSERMDWLADEAAAIARLTGTEHFLQASGPARAGERSLF